MTKLPPLDDVHGTHCGCGGYWQTFENGTFCKDCDRRKITPRYLAELTARGRENV
jgi:hypothetical protein